MIKCFLTTFLKIIIAFNMRSTLSTHFLVYNSVDNYRHNIVQQISRIYSSCITETLHPCIKEQLPISSSIWPLTITILFCFYELFFVFCSFEAI